MSRYNVGDRVVVRDDLKLHSRYYMADGVNADSFVEGMEKLMGAVVTIQRIRPNTGKYELCEDPCYWTDEMFVGLESEVFGADKIAVEDLI